MVDYAYFWNVYSNKIDIDTLSNYNIVKLDDLLEIIWFINPMGLHNILRNLGGYNMVKIVHEKAIFLQHWVRTRHGNFHNLIMFGWRQLPNNYPSYDSAPPLKKIELARWILKPFLLNPSHQNNSFISRGSYLAKNQHGNTTTSP